MAEKVKGRAGAWEVVAELESGDMEVRALGFGREEEVESRGGAETRGAGRGSGRWGSEG
jgi:hypothetical protein